MKSVDLRAFQGTESGQYRNSPLWELFGVHRGGMCISPPPNPLMFQVQSKRKGRE